MQIHRNRRFRIPAFLCIVFLIALSGTGCSILKEVKQTVEDTNRAMLTDSSMLPSSVLPDAEGKHTIEGWEEPSARIDAFIAKNPNDKVTASAMRVRQAMLLLSYRKYELASAAFEQATDLKQDRDIALKNLQKSLIWWFKLDKHKAPDFTSAASHVAAFTAEIERLKDGSENQQIKQYLEEMRAWIEIHMAEKSTDHTFMAKFIGEAMDHYAETLSDADIIAINEGKPTPGLGPFSTNVRRQVRAMTVIKRAEAVVDDVKKLEGTVNYQKPKAKQINAINPNQ